MDNKNLLKTELSFSGGRHALMVSPKIGKQCHACSASHIVEPDHVIEGCFIVCKTSKCIEPLMALGEVKYLFVAPMYISASFYPPGHHAASVKANFFFRYVDR